jgi:hypothetical protein
MTPTLVFTTVVSVVIANVIDIVKVFFRLNRANPCANTATNATPCTFVHDDCGEPISAGRLDAVLAHYEEICDKFGFKQLVVPFSDESDKPCPFTVQAKSSNGMFISAPFTDEQVASINDYQINGGFHPMTCNGFNCHGELMEATNAGMICSHYGNADYWAWAWSFDGSWKMANVPQMKEWTFGQQGQS